MGSGWSAVRSYIDCAEVSDAVADRTAHCRPDCPLPTAYCLLPTADFFFIFPKFVLETVEQGNPTCLDDVSIDADGAPDVVFVLAFDQHADAGGGGGFGVDDADLIIDQPQLVQAREIGR